MFFFNPLSRAHRRLRPVRRLFVALVCGILLPGHGGAQTTPARTSTSSSAPSKDGSAALGFSIESEMLTYRALQSNSEAVACDIAAYLNRVDAAFTSSTGGSRCSVKPSAKPIGGVILLPFDQNVIDGLQLWRADVEIMNELRQRATTYCPASPQIEVHDRGAAAAAGAVLDLTPASSALTLAQSAIGMAASQSDTSPVEGTIQDQAFLNTVARQLRVLGVSVITPNVYHPYTLNGLDDTKSPFLASLERFLASHDCMQSKDATKEPALGEVLGEMNTFLTTLNGNTPVASKSNTANVNSGSTSIGMPQTQAAASSSVLVAVLSADGLAQKLGVDPATGKLQDNGEWRHVLFLKALESGGSVSRESSIFGTKIRYSGGAVGTYELVTLDGELECSGNVFDFGGSVKAKNFEKDLRRYTPDLSSQLVFQRGGCAIPTNP